MLRRSNMPGNPVPSIVRYRRQCQRNHKKLNEIEPLYQIGCRLDDLGRATTQDFPVCSGYTSSEGLVIG